MARTAMSRRKKRNNFRGYLALAAVVCVIAIIVMIQGNQTKAKLAEYQLREEELDAQIEAENLRTEELEIFAKEVQTDAYAEEQAQEKLNLLKENQIMFKAQ